MSQPCRVLCHCVSVLVCVWGGGRTGGEGCGITIVCRVAANVTTIGNGVGVGMGWNGVGWRTGSKEYGSVYTRVAAAVLCGSSDSDPVPGTVVGQETKHRVTLRADRL